MQLSSRSQEHSWAYVSVPILTEWWTLKRERERDKVNNRMTQVCFFLLALRVYLLFGWAEAAP